MATFNSLLASPILIAEATSSAASAVTLTVAAAGGGSTDTTRNTIAIYGFEVSGSAVPAAAIAVLLKTGAGAVTVSTMQLGTGSLVTPVRRLMPEGHPYIVPAGSNVTLLVPSLGGSGVATATLYYAIVTV